MKEPVELTTEEKIREIIATNLGLAEVRDDQTLAELEAESMDIVEAIMCIENEFDIELDDEAFMDATTVGQLVEVAMVEIGKKAVA